MRYLYFCAWLPGSLDCWLPGSRAPWLCLAAWLPRSLAAWLSGSAPGRPETVPREDPADDYSIFRVHLGGFGGDVRGGFGGCLGVFGEFVRGKSVENFKKKHLNRFKTN